MSLKTPLYSNHVALGARMVDFHGWDMPLHYGSQLEEHHTVRQHAGVFDVSHMTIVDVLGAGGRQFLRRLLANDIDRLKLRNTWPRIALDSRKNRWLFSRAARTNRAFDAGSTRPRSHSKNMFYFTTKPSGSHCATQSIRKH